MRIAIHQPDYIPWLGLYYKIAHCDTFVYLDDAQFSNEGGHNFNVIKTPQGALRLRIPVENSFGNTIMEVRTKDELKWKDKQLKTISQAYARAKHYDEVFPGFADVILKDYPNLSELNIAINKYICDGFQIHTKCTKTSQMDIKTRREERILDICSLLNADEYLSGNGARVYQDEDHFTQRGIKLSYLDYQPIEYTQLWHDFLPSMSVLDYIFNCGFDWQYVEEQVARINSQGIN